MLEAIPQPYAASLSVILRLYTYAGGRTSIQSCAQQDFWERISNLVDLIHLCGLGFGMFTDRIRLRVGPDSP